MKLKLKRSRLLFFTCIYMCSVAQAQDAELAGIELTKAPSNFKDAPPYNFGTKLTFFVNDTAGVTGLTKSYKVEKWVTNSGKDLKKEHQSLAKVAVEEDYRKAKDTTILSKRGFQPENGKGFIFKIHSWALPNSDATTMTIKGEIYYTVLEPADVLVEDITHLAGNIDGLKSLEFKGNTIDLKQKSYGKGESAYMTFNGTVTNKTYEAAIQSMQFLDVNGKLIDELYFGLNNQYNANTRNNVDLKNAAVIRMYYRKLKIKKIRINRTFGLGF
ncbi:hypothetical protein [uncultured Croceitalea sp.]|uniref:hypothetical protein n=1 Tax=uncultured Croceitalea sp. TaxID=1798908 RepID=UPI00330685F2